MGKKKIVLMLISLLMIVAVTSCDRPPEPDNSETANKQMQAQNTAEKQMQEDSTHISVGETYEMRGTKSGHLLWTCTGVRLVSHIEDIEKPENFLRESMIYFENPKIRDEDYQYPNFIQQDGSFAAGVSCLLADFTVHNVDAEGYTSRNRNIMNQPMEEWDDPYLFRPQMALVDTSILFVMEKPDAVTGKIPEPYYYSTGIAYYSRLGEWCTAPELMGHMWSLYRVEPGEDVNFTLGFLVVDKNVVEGANDLGALRLSCYGDQYPANNLFIDLNLNIGGE